MSGTRTEAEARASIVRAALAEVGYPEADVIVKPVWLTDRFTVAVEEETVPEAAIWTAYYVTSLSLPGWQLACWPCWQAWRTRTCDHDPAVSERPVLGGVR